jgi:hypothetical protein
VEFDPSQKAARHHLMRVFFIQSMTTDWEEVHDDEPDAKHCQRSLTTDTKRGSTANAGTRRANSAQRATPRLHAQPSPKH